MKGGVAGLCVPDFDKIEEAGSLYWCGQEGLLPFLLFPGIARVLCVWDPLALVGSTLGDPLFTWLT